MKKKKLRRRRRNPTHQHKKGDKYLVTGITVSGKRFRIKTDNPIHAFGINLYQGTVWLLRRGKRKMLKRVS